MTCFVGRREYGKYVRDDKHEQEPEPCLGIHSTLLHMVPFPHARPDTHLIHSKTLDGNKLVFTVKELGFHRGVGHEDATLY